MKAIIKILTGLGEKQAYTIDTYNGKDGVVSTVGGKISPTLIPDSSDSPTIVNTATLASLEERVRVLEQKLGIIDADNDGSADSAESIKDGSQVDLGEVTT